MQAYRGFGYWQYCHGGLLCKKVIYLGLSIVFLMSIFSGVLVIRADETILRMYENLDDNSYVLYIPNGGGFIRNSDGSSNFSDEQISETGGSVMKVSEAKIAAAEYMEPQNNVKFRSTFPKTRSLSISAGQSATETVFGSGWQHSRFFYSPAPKTGAYLLWTSHNDSGVVYDSAKDIQAIEANSPTYILSDVNRETAKWGVAYKTYNAPSGTYITIANW